MNTQIYRGFLIYWIPKKTHEHVRLNLAKSSLDLKCVGKVKTKRRTNYQRVLTLKLRNL